MTYDGSDFDARWERGADRSGGPLACWPWLGKGSKDNKSGYGGYGRIRYAGRIWYAHRLAFFLRYGTKPEAVCHRCDNPPCVNPLHLREGTLSDNTAEMWAKGRQGANNAKLPLDAIAVIRARYSRTTRDALAAEYGVSKRTIYRVVFGPMPKIYRTELEVAA